MAGLIQASAAHRRTQLSAIRPRGYGGLATDLDTAGPQWGRAGIAPTIQAGFRGFDL